MQGSYRKDMRVYAGELQKRYESLCWGVIEYISEFTQRSYKIHFKSLCKGVIANISEFT